MGCKLTTEEVAHIDQTIAQLRDENAKLREQGERLFDKTLELGTENAKLRELVKDMAEEIRGLGVDFKRVGWCDYTDRMRELGVEV